MELRQVRQVCRPVCVGGGVRLGDNLLLREEDTVRKARERSRETREQTSLRIERERTCMASLPIHARAQSGAHKLLAQSLIGISYIL